MKKILYLAAALLIVSCSTQENSYLDRSQVPEAGPAPTLNIGKATEFTLSNGLQVIVVENHKLPRVSYQLRIDRAPMMEGDMVGMLGMLGDMMKAGTSTRSKDQLNEEIDFIGASLSASSSGIYASSLKKHAGSLLELMTDVLYNPVFPEEELEKNITQAKSGIQSSKNDPSAISSNVGNVLRYSKKHPYGEITTEESLDNITIDALRSYYETFYRPNISYLVIVGDITPEEAKSQAEEYFAQWERQEAPKINVPVATAPKANKVAFVDRPGAVQSVITITYPVQFEPSSPDAIAARVMNEILGGAGFSGRLMANLREDKAYTYGAYSSLGSDRYVGSFSASASVRNEVTDSAITQFIHEFKRIINEDVTEEKLSLIKNKLTGSFARSLESPQTVANFALNRKLYDLPADYYDTYLTRLNALTVEDIRKAANKYIKPEAAHILVVGNKSEVADKVMKFDADGKIDFYDSFGDPVKEMEPAPEGMTAEDVVKASIEKMGGRKTLEAVTSIVTKHDILVQGMSVEMITKKSNGKLLNVVQAGGTIFNKTVYDGKSGKRSGMMGSAELEGDELIDVAKQARIFDELFLIEESGDMKLLGIQDGMYVIEMEDSDGDISFEYYSVETGLKMKSEGTSTGPQGEVAYNTEVNEYEEYEGIMFAKEVSQTTGPQSMVMKLKEIQINPDIPDSDFE